MQLPDDNYDELYRKAAADYPLKTDSSNWDVVGTRLKNTSPKKITRGRKWQLTALLLFLIAGSFFMINHYSNNSEGTASTLPQQKTSPSDLDKANNTTGISQPQTTAIVSDEMNKSTLSARGENPGRNTPPLDHNLFDDLNSVQAPLLEPRSDQENLSQSNQNVPFKEEGVNSDNNATISPQKLANNIKEENKDQKQGASNIHLKLLSKPRTFYGTFYVGPELSTVKCQQVDKLGYRIGIALGYRINNRLNVELGVERENKHFFSDGKYFDRSQLKLKESTTIETLNGNAVLTDIPVTVRYNFHPRCKGQFFATAGFSAVLITHTEKYNYAVTKNGEPDNLTRNFGSSAHAKYFSSIHASAGYEAPIGSSLSLRVEPYFQTHIHGFGIGDLPLNSFGIGVGIVKNFK